MLYLSPPVLDERGRPVLSLVPYPRNTQYCNITPTGTNKPFLDPSSCMDQLGIFDRVTLSSSSVVQHLIGPLPLAAALLFKIHHESSSSHSSNTVSGRQAQAACQEIIVQRAVHNMLLSLHNLILSAVWTFSLRSSRFRYRREDGLPLSLMLNLMVKLTLAVSAISSKKTKTFLSEIWTEFVKDPIDSSTRYERISRRKG